MIGQAGERAQPTHILLDMPTVCTLTELRRRTSLHSAQPRSVLERDQPLVASTHPDHHHVFHCNQRRRKVWLAPDRDSGLSTVTVTPATIATAAVARSARGNVVVSPVLTNGDGPTKSKPAAQESDDARPHSPNSTESHSSASSSSTSGSLSMSTGTESASSDSRPQTLTASEAQDWRPPGGKPKSLNYLDSPEPSPRVASFAERDVNTTAVHHHRPLPVRDAD
ncbi:hypothetical protein NUW54_g13001 [Trametes sanguinea]|uniref:Uncharacterized protein n=1 Tax=Trametes sanguinea TaxID=158606 RepID=A0ACC1MSP2_9APHY|nr:hypothetical protein NUW54_g13001 [Trametes sanguinea]